MQVIIEQIVSQVRAFDADISASTLRRVIGAAMEAMRAEMQQRERLDEECSLQNHQQRIQSRDR